MVDPPTDRRHIASMVDPPTDRHHIAKHSDFTSKLDAHIGKHSET